MAPATPQFLYSAADGEGHTDSRPCFNKAGDRVVFMRQTPPARRGYYPPGSLYTVSATPSTTNTPERLFPQEEPTEGNQATRPDWSWGNNTIAFSGTQTGNGLVTDGLFIIESDGSDCRHVPINAGEGQGIQYPSWYPDGRHIAVTNYANNQILRVDSMSTNGDFDVLTEPSEIWAGMSSVNQKSPGAICMAAQPPTVQTQTAQYNQDDNHIWIQPPLPAQPFCIQVEGHGIGRAPWWSPCGRFIAFESDYQTTSGQYAIYVYRLQDQSLTLVTPLDGWFCQHPKWHPTISNRLVIGATHDDGIERRSGIAIVDIPELS